VRSCAETAAHEIDVDLAILEGRSVSERAAACSAVVAAVAVGLAVVWSISPPRETAEVFGSKPSIERLIGHVTALASAPRPPGTSGHQRAREYIVSELRALGFEVDEQRRTAAVERAGGTVVAARLVNLVARRRPDPSRTVSQTRLGAVGLMAHYDSRPNTLGAADNAAGVATVLETLRLLTADSGRRRDLVAIFTDGEEVGLLGARSLAQGHPWLDDLEFLLNLEARGSSGPSILFETSSGGLSLVEAFAESAPFPLATSLSSEAYRRMPVDTDFTVFKGRELQGFNFAFIGGYASYHTMLDTAGDLNPRSLWHQSANVVALAARLTELEGSLEPRSDGVFFTLPGWNMVVYPVSTGILLALATLLLAAAALWRARRQLRTSGGLLRGAVLAIVGPIAGVIAGGVVWELVILVPSGAAFAPHQRPHEPMWFAGGAFLLTVLLTSLAARKLTRNVRALEAFGGTLLVWTLAALALAWSLPGVGYLLVWPAAAGWFAWSLVTRDGEGPSWLGVHVAAGAAALVGVVLFAPVLPLLLDALTLSALPVLGGAFGFLLTLFSPQLAVIGGMKSARKTQAALAVVLLFAGWARTPAAPDRPHADSLLYLVEESGSWWYSLDARTDAWTGRFLGTEPERVQAPGELLLAGRTMLRAPAPSIALRRPAIRMAGASADGGRTLRQLEIRPGSGGQVLRLKLSSPLLLRVSLDNQWFDVDRSATGIRIVLVGAGDQPWRIGLEIAETTDEHAELEVDVLEQKYGFPDGLGVGRRPSTLVARTSLLTDSSFVLARERVPLIP
jgi:hypothetical protein